MVPTARFYMLLLFDQIQDKSICGSNILTMVDTFQSLGFSINKGKSVFEPTQRIIFFGFILDSVLLLDENRGPSGPKSLA